MRAVLRVTAVALGLGLVWFVSSGLPADPGAVTALAIAAAAVATASLVSTVRTLGSIIAALFGASAPPHPDDDVDLPVTILQSRPDAPGRPRTRAPGRLLAAA